MKHAVLSGLVALLLIGGFHFATTTDAAASGSVQAAVHVVEPRAEPVSNPAAVVQLRAAAGTRRTPAHRPASVTADALARAEALRLAIGRGRQADAPAPSVADEDPEYGPGNVTNRAELPEDLMRTVNEDLMPLVDECIDLARDLDPELEGMLALQVHALGDSDLGAVIDSVQTGARNQVLDLELLECVRESAFSLVLPPPGVSGEHAFELTLDVGDED